MHRTCALLAVVFIVAPYVVGTSVYAPVITQYVSFPVEIDSDYLSELEARAVKYSELINELAGYRTLGVHGDFPVRIDDELRRRILAGHLQAPDGRWVAIDWPRAADIFDSVPGALELDLASLKAASQMLDAYWLTGSDDYLHSAIAYVDAFLELEQSLWLPRGLVWNDHAIAARVMFLTRLLMELSTQAEPTTLEHRRLLLVALDRHVRLLSDPALYTFRSNHGLMQNIAVLHAAIVVPGLPAVQQNLGDVRARLTEQIESLVTEAGVFTEHSIGYQGFDLNLLGQALRYSYLLDGTVPARWLAKYEDAFAFYQHVRRPDGSLPRHGDTGGQPGALRYLLESGRRPLADDLTASMNVPIDQLLIASESGYWSDRGADYAMLVTWADFPSGVHKHADELSLHFWQAGRRVVDCRRLLALWACRPRIGCWLARCERAALPE